MVVATWSVSFLFCGWHENYYLQLNMEVKLDLVQIPNLKEFVSHLTQTMHSSLPGSLVIWWELGDFIISMIVFFLYKSTNQTLFSIDCWWYTGMIVLQQMANLAGKINWMKKINLSLIIVMEFL